jgi:hypothetical protein
MAPNSGTDQYEHVQPQVRTRRLEQIQNINIYLYVYDVTYMIYYIFDIIYMFLYVHIPLSLSIFTCYTTYIEINIFMYIIKSISMRM